MIVIYKDNFQQIEVEYPNKDVSIPVVNLNKIKVDGKFVDDNENYIQYYFIETTELENPNPERYNLIRKPDKLTNEVHTDYKHLKICKRVSELVEKPESEIIERLNTELGNYLDSEYPIWERNKHLQKFLFEQTPEKIDYIRLLGEWLNECRAIRKTREESYILNRDNFPEFGNYPKRP